MLKQKKSELGYSYFISSAHLTASHPASSVREHSCIENELRWVLDVIMDEDNCQIYRGHEATNLASMRHMTLNMLRAETSKALSVPRKQRRTLLHEDYLEQILMNYLDENKM